MDGADGVDSRGPLDVTRAATAVLDARGRVIGWSPAAAELLGYEAHDVLGRPADDLLARRAGTGGRAGPPGAEQSTRSAVLHLRHRDGRSLRIATTMVPVSSEGSGPAWLFVAADSEELDQWEAQQAMLQGLVTRSSVGLAIYSADMRVVWINAELKREMGSTQYVGMSPDEMLLDGEVLSEGYPPTLEQVMRTVFATGEPVIDLHYGGRAPVDPEHDRVWSCSYYRLQDTQGKSLGMCEESVDITDRYRAQQRLALLVRAGARIGTTLDMSRTARELAEVAVPQFADAITVDLLEAVLEGDQTTPGTTAGRRLVRMWGDTGRAGGTTGAGAPRHSTRRLVDYPPASAQARSLALGRKILETGPNPQHTAHDVKETPDAKAAQEPLLRSCLAVPLRAGRSPIGLVTFFRNRYTDPFDDGELDLADELVARTAVCIDNARRFTREHTAALRLQRSLLPQSLPPQTAVELAYRYLPADSRAGVGGDWFDVIPLSGTRVGLVVGDVVGHGLGAAATMGRLRTSVRVLAQLDLAPDELLTRLDNLVGQSAKEWAAVRGVRGGGPEDDEALGATCLYAVYDPVTGQCSMARAGHPLPAVVDAETGLVSYPELPAGPPLGLGGLPFESTDLQLPAGSLIALFTNGLVQSSDRDIDAGLDRLDEILAEHRRPLEELADRTVSTLLPGPSDDDAALLLVRTRRLDKYRVAVWELAADPVMVGRARAAATGQLGEWGLDDVSFTTELIVSELVTNAIRYAEGPILLRLIRDQTLICEVSDSGHTSPHMRHAASDDEGGRGLFLIAQMTEHWGTRYTPTGKTIWAEQDLPPADSAERADP
ncbi:SpoIIE family protein phosphatase [Streptomyces sp. RKAG337]|uniref:SpoIIE family protein phosphatase n=1 Tax=Streptomyces sp. RKAG337 TaxID=2893404 RepID=UPI0020340AA8|nr:SpoIIE family protein phosphatase [Streptomyces sp. RKAG337]MCM2424778.1 SpoIIE family protein phosphatase [Streptomyces sp. RKAG337]